MTVLARASFCLVLPLVVLTACGRPPVAGSVDTRAGTATLSAMPAQAVAARAFVATLPDSTRSVAVRPFDDADRSRWFFIPTEIVPDGRAGLPLKRMTPAQREAAFGLLGTALSESGYRTARAIIANELLLGEIERAANAVRYVRSPELYFVTLFGTAGGAEPWGWRVEGHHLSVNVTGEGSARPVATPLFMGANPHRVVAGPTAGSRLLAAEEDVARALLATFTPAQRARVIVSDTTYGEMRTRNDPKARPLPQEGIAAAEMTPAQQTAMRALIDVYSSRMERSMAVAKWQRIEEASFERVRFVWAGSTEVGKAHYYRIHGPTVLIEYDNSQNGANHSHTVWRDLENDFGGDLLRAHYQRHPH